MHFTARALGVLFLLLELSSAIPAEVPPPSITAAPSILDAVQNQRRGDDSPTSTSSIQPKHFAPFRDGLLMCRAGNREAFNYTLGNKQHYMEQSKIKHMIKYQVCNSLKEDHSDVPDKGKEWALTYEDHGDDYKHYHILVRWNNGHTCGRNSTVFFDESKCNDLIGGIADKCNSPGIESEYTNFGGVFTNKCLKFDISSEPREKDTDNPKASPKIPVTSTEMVTVTAS